MCEHQPAFEDGHPRRQNIACIAAASIAQLDHHPDTFLDSVAVAYLDFYNNEMLTREKGVLDVVRRSGGVDTIRRLLNERDVLKMEMQTLSVSR